MTPEALKRGMEIGRSISEVKEQIKLWGGFDGKNLSEILSDGATFPVELTKTVQDAALTELRTKLKALQDEFDAL